MNTDYVSAEDVKKLYDELCPIEKDKFIKSIKFKEIYLDDSDLTEICESQNKTFITEPSEAVDIFGDEILHEFADWQIEEYCRFHSVLSKKLLFDLLEEELTIWAKLKPEDIKRFDEIFKHFEDQVTFLHKIIDSNEK